MFELEISAPDPEGREARPEELPRIDATFESFQDFVAHTGSRLSPSRIFLETAETLPAGIAVRLEIALRSGAALVRALGQVATTPEPEEGDAGDRDTDRPPGLELRFTYLDPASARVVDSVARLAGRDRPAQLAAPLAAARPEPEPEAIELSELSPEDGGPSPPPEPPAPDAATARGESLAPSLDEEELATEPAEISWELEVDSLLSEVLPATADAPPPAAGGSRGSPRISRKAWARSGASGRRTARRSKSKAAARLI